MNRNIRVKLGCLKKALRQIFGSKAEGIKDIKKHTAYIPLQDRMSEDHPIFSVMDIKFDLKLALDDTGNPYVFNFAFKGKADIVNQEVLKILKKSNGSSLGPGCEEIRVLGPIIINENNQIDTSELKTYDEIAEFKKKVPASGGVDKNGLPHMVDVPLISKSDHESLIENLSSQTLNNGKLQDYDSADLTL